MLTYASTVTASTVGLGNSLQLVFLLNRIRIGGTLTGGRGERERERASIFFISYSTSHPFLSLSPPPPHKKLNFHLSIGTLNEEATSKQKFIHVLLQFSRLGIKTQKYFHQLCQILNGTATSLT